MVFGDPQSYQDLTRAEYAMKHGYDPWFLFCNQQRNKDHPVCKGFEERCKKRGTDIGNTGEIDVSETDPVRPSE
jgi:hypothetical protein